MKILLWFSPLLLLLLFAISWVVRDSYVYREQRVVGGIFVVAVGLAAFSDLARGRFLRRFYHQRQEIVGRDYRVGLA